MQTVTNLEIATTTAASFPAEPASATSARQFVSGVLQPVLDDDLVAVAALLTTELATNSILHADTAIDVEVTVSDDEVRVEVSDAHPTAPRRIHAEPLSTFGRGLALVDHLSKGWGVSARAAGKGVWFSLAR